MPDDPYNNDLLDFQRKISEDIRKDKTPPESDPFDPETFPFGKEPGANKFGLKVCATCGKPPTDLKGTEHENFMPNGAFMFRDELSAREYYISAMCQACQDEIFKKFDQD